MWRLRAVKEPAAQIGRNKRMRQRHRGLKSEALHEAGAHTAGSGIFRTYSRLLETNPIATKALTSAAIAGLGDIGCQIYTKRMLTTAAAELEDNSGAIVRRSAGPHRAQPPLIEWTRCAKFMLLSGALFAPCAHYWYGLLGRWLPGQTLGVATKRMALDQFVFSPVFTGVFFSALMVLQVRESLSTRT